MLAKVLKIVPYFFYAIIILFAFFGLSSKYVLPGGFKIFTVMSGSMQPKIMTGSLVLVQKQPVYKVGEAISFILPKSTTTVTHRIISIDVEKTADKEVGKFTTKGDANDVTDNEIVLKENIIGKVVFSVPWFGYPVSFTKTLPGLILLIVIPSTIIIYTELLNVKTEAQKLIARIKTPKAIEVISQGASRPERVFTEIKKIRKNTTGISPNRKSRKVAKK